MAFTIAYKTLIEINFWQHFLLDSNSDDLTLPPGPTTPDAIVQRLLEYDLRNILRIVPTKYTQKILTEKRLIFKPTTTGCFLVAKDTYTETEDDFRLSFVVSLIDPEWPKYTDLGVNSLSGNIFHLTNFGTTPDARTLLTSGGNQSLRAGHFVPQSGRIVHLSPSAPGAATTINVFDELSSVATPVLSITFPPGYPLPMYQIDGRSLREGLYRFEGTNILTTTRYLGLEDYPNAVGVVDVMLKNWEGAIFDVRLAKF